MKVHLIDGTYELFRAYYGAPAAAAPDGREVGATRAFMRSMLGLLRDPGVTHVAAAFDHELESFRNELFGGYKTGEGVEPELRSQFDLVEAAASALGIVIWPMIEFEADDALATGAALYRDEPRVTQVVICSPDKDMSQCVRTDRVVCLDRMRGIIRNEGGVVEKFGVSPVSIPDYLGLVGDTADGIPGLTKWGAKSSSTLLARYKHIDAIPDSESDWDIKVRGASGLAKVLRENRDDAELFRLLATLREDVPIRESLDDIEWRGVPRGAFEACCAELGERNLHNRVPRWIEDGEIPF